MNERKYTEEIEGLMVEITYEYEEGSDGDYFTPPILEGVTILSWRLLEGEKNVRNKYPDYDDEEWDEWMNIIDDYVHEDSEWDILKYEHEKEDWL